MKKEAKKIAKNAIKKIKEEQKKPYTIETTFGLAGSKPLAMTDKMKWNLKLEINEILNRSFYRYNIHLSINEKPFEHRLEEIDRVIREEQDSGKLFIDRKKVTRLQAQKKEVKEELEKLLKETDEISLYAQVVNLKYNGTKTDVEFEIPADNIQLLNKNRFYFGYYQISLQPILEVDIEK